jgi:hypothetical protein
MKYEYTLDVCRVMFLSLDSCNTPVGTAPRQNALRVWHLTDTNEFRRLQQRPRETGNAASMHTLSQVARGLYGHQPVKMTYFQLWEDRRYQVHMKSHEARKYYNWGSLKYFMTLMSIRNTIHEPL